MEQRQSLLERRDMHHRLPATMKYQMIPLPFLWRRVIVSANPSHNKQHNSLFRNAPVYVDPNCVWDYQVSLINYLSVMIVTPCCNCDLLRSFRKSTVARVNVSMVAEIANAAGIATTPMRPSRMEISRMRAIN